MYMSKRSTFSNLTCSPEAPLITEIRCTFTEKFIIPILNMSIFMKDEITMSTCRRCSLPKLEVELGSLAQEWTSGLQSFTMFSISAESLRLWVARLSGHNHYDYLMGDYELPICLMQKIPWAGTFSSQLRAGHPNFQASRFNSEIKLIYSSCH